MIIILTNLQFIPSIKGCQVFEFSILTYNAFTILNLLLVLLGLLEFVRFLYLFIINKKLNKKALFLIVLGILGYLNTSILHKYMSEVAKSIAIKNSKELICSIDKYYCDNSSYPDNLEKLFPKYLSKIPKTGVNGIKTYYFENLGNNYEIRFIQNYFMNFNYDVVIYNPKAEHKGKGEYPKLIETGYENWKYYWFD